MALSPVTQPSVMCIVRNNGPLEDGNVAALHYKSWLPARLHIHNLFVPTHVFSTQLKADPKPVLAVTIIAEHTSLAVKHIRVSYTLHLENINGRLAKVMCLTCMYYPSERWMVVASPNAKMTSAVRSPDDRDETLQKFHHMKPVASM